MGMVTAAAPSRSLAAQYEQAFPTSRKLHLEAKQIFPNGVTHDLRHMEPFPIYVDRAEGAHKWDVDGHRLIDYWAGHGALLLGHSHPAVVKAVEQQMPRATHPGACHELEIAWGRIVQELVPSAEKLRFVSSGTEATLMALRLARLFTGKPRLLKFAGHFHGWHDYVIEGSDLPYHGGGVPGVPPEVSALTVIVPPNDPEIVERTLANDDQIGCVILEPTGGHFGSVPVRGEYLRNLREITSRLGRLLIFDEVITGFRVHPGGAQGHYGVKPDLTTLAKILAGGLPGGCLAGRADILEGLEFRSGKPKMKHPGTFNANPLSAAAGIACLKIVSTAAPCRQANDMGRLLRQRLNDLFSARQVPWAAYGDFSAIKILPGYHEARPAGDDFIPYGGDFAKFTAQPDKRIATAFRQAMLLCGVDLPGLGGMTTAAHTIEDIDATIAAVDGALDLMGNLVQ